MRIEITPKGLKVEASGYAGKECQKDLEDLEAFLKAEGIDIRLTDQKLKAEAYATATQTNMTTLKRY